MSTGDDELSSGINGRLRPRKSYACSPQTTKATRKLDSKSSQEKSKRVTTPSKAFLTKLDDLSKKSDCSSAVEYLCPYCDKFFVSKQTASKHTRRIHFSASKQDTFINCLYCNHTEQEPNEIFKHMIDSHPNQYFACLDCHTRYSSTTELAEHKLNICERQKLPYRSKLRQKSSGTNKKSLKIDRQIIIRDEVRQGYNSIVISCELKPTHISDGADIEDNITTNLILPSNKNLGKVIDKNAVILLDDLQWNKRIPHNFSFHNTDADQILSRLGVVHRSPRTGESTRKDWFKTIDDTSQKFERCFDTSFYSKVASNVQENLSKFLDGSFNFNPDPNHTIKYRKAKNSVPINTVEGFPILLSCEQYSRNLFDGYMPRAIAPKHKWKWDNLENDRNPFNADQIKRDSHINNCIVTLVSSLDIWTQLCMRKKFEEKFKTTPLEKKTEKKKIIGNELKEILESRQLPIPHTHITRKCGAPTVREGLDFPSSLGLTPTSEKYEIQPAVLSGEWVRPRCYVCCACGAQTRDPRALSSHISMQHPNAQVQHYEIPGELLLNADILKHLYVPPSPVHNRTRLPRGFRECTKCNKSITLEELHQHMLDCAGDTPTVRRKCRYRQFGMRKRRSRIQDSRIRKKLGKDIHSQSGITRPKIRSEVGDAETIRKMLADLPAKRHRVMITPLSSNLRPKRKIVKQRNLLALKKRLTEESKNRKANEGNITQGTNKPEICDLNKINNAQDDNKTIKRIQNKLTRRTNILNKKTVRKTRRKSVERRQMTENKNTDDQPTVYDFSNSSACSVKIQPEELSVENEPKRININSGPYNTREQANRSSNDGSNNRDNQHPDPNDNNGNSRDQGVPPQNVPLKHSIARLTADSDTQDKAVQFHHLFLVQQECNNVTQHLPSGQPVLFENKAVAAKLDKPPLDYYQKDEDAQNCQKTKLTKHRKGLNDCIAMLKNKLGEPISKAPNVSIQCKMDEPNESPINFAPQTVKNLNRIDITVQCPDDSQSTDTIMSPRYRQPTTGSKTIEDHISILPTIGEYIEQNPELLIKHNITLNSVSQDIENNHTLIGNKDVCISKTQNIQPRDDLSKSNIPGKSPKPNYNSQTKNAPSEIIKESQNIGDGVDINESNNKVLQPVKMPISQTKAISNTSTLIGTHASVITKIKDAEINLKDIKPQNNKLRDRSLRLNEESNQNVTIFDYQEENKPKNKFNASDTIPPAHCNTGIESILTSPLDLSGKLYANEVVAHSSKQGDLYKWRSCEHYETLDLSNKGISKQNRDVPMLPFNEEVVDLRVKHIISTQSADSSIYSEESSSNISTMTDLSLTNTEIHCTPTDLSIKGKPKSESLYSNKMRKEVNIHSDLRPTPDLIGKETNTLCLNLSAKELPCLDLSRKISSLVTPTNKHLIENKKCSSSNIDNDKNKFINPVGLSCRNNQEKHVHAQSNKLTSQIVEGNTNVDANKAVTKIPNITLSSKSMNNNEVLGYETNENQSRKVRYGTSEFLAKPSSSDITISIRNKQNSNLTGTDLTNPRNSSELLMKPNAEKVTYSFDKTLNVDNLSSALSKSGLSGIKCDISSNIPILCHVSNPLSIEGISSKSSIKLSNSAIANTSTAYTTSEPVSTASNYGYKPELAPKHSIEKQDLHFHTSKSRHMQNKQQGKKVENSDKIISSGVDQDPETAKKIAMLPKELVEILGNMPVNHRNQLLNVLPQYVSTSISPPPNRQDAVNVSPLSTSDDSKNNSVPSSQNTFLRKDPDVTHAAQYVYSGIPRSQESLVEQYQIHHSTNSHKKSQTLTNKSHVDALQAAGPIEGNVCSLSIEDMKTKRYSNDITEDPIIDLTDDNVDIKHAISSPEKENKTVAIGVQSLGLKSNNEKTASLRAVRIKAPSERQKLIIADTQLNKAYHENNNIKLNILDNNKDVSPLAVQQFEISTTEEAKDINLQSSISVISPDSSFINSNHQKSSPEDIDSIHETRRENIMPLEIDNVNIKLNNVPPITTQSLLMSPKPDFLNNDQNKLSSDVDPVLLETHPNSIKSSEEGHQIQKKIEEDDSEDDVSLAIIVKQKMREQTKALSSQVSETVKNDFDTPKLETVINTHGSDLFVHNSTCDLMGNATDDKILNDVVGNCTNNVKEGKKYKQAKKIKKTRGGIATKANADNVFSTNQAPGSDVNKETVFNSNEKKEVEIINGAKKILERNQEKYSGTGNEETSKNIETKYVEENIKEKILNEVVDISEDVKDSLSDFEKLNRKTVELNSNNIETDEKVQKYSNNPSLNSSKSLCVSKEDINDEHIGNQMKLNQLPHSNSSTQLELLKTMHKEEPAFTVYKCEDIKERNNALLNSENFNFITPLRRSRRGKSLFVESSDIPYDNKNNPDIGIDPRGPLTKKQLIFSKLLQDEENTVTHTKNCYPERHEELEQNEYQKSMSHSSDVNTRDETEAVAKKVNKRKQSPQTKKKPKKKKSTDKSYLLIEDLNNVSKEAEINIFHKEAKIKHDDVKLVSKKMLTNEENILPKFSEEDESVDETVDTSIAFEKNLKPMGKRKSNINNKEVSSSSKPKKFKFCIDNEVNEVNLGEQRKEEGSVESIPQVGNRRSGYKPAARRGRSKSVFVKSSAPEMYDPYDIDLEDMVTTTEPFLKRESLNRTMIMKKVNKTSTENCDDSRSIGTNAPSTSVINNNNYQKEPENITNVMTMAETKAFLSDSDDSSKSDEPLKKYVEEKEKKKLELKHQEKNIEEPCKVSRKKNKKVHSVNSEKIDNVLNRDENEERIRSEQFMESFGFFSERKPRKSNLLASKKISETFHIIANENDDSFFESKDKSNKKSLQSDNRKSADDEGNLNESFNTSHKKVSKRGRKKNMSKIEPSFCGVCRKEFRRPDNFLRHQMTLAHATRVSEVELKVKNVPMIEESNYLVIYKKQLDRLRALQNKINRRKKYCKSLEKISLPTLEEIIADVSRTVRQQHLARRGLSRDEALFLDCCELLNASYNNDGTGRVKGSSGCKINCYSCAQTSAECLNLLEKRIDENLKGKCDDGDVDSITAQDILESEEVRNLENDLISGLKEAACANSFSSNTLSHATYMPDIGIAAKEDFNKVCHSTHTEIDHHSEETKKKKVFEVKEKMYPDVIEDIDMFEDKFDKIKRKCRSQAAKQTQYVETSISPKSRKKVDKKKKKKSLKKNSPNAVPTKGALKGFEGVKVSILTSEINMSSILPPSSTPMKKKKRSNSKRKKERKHSDPVKYDSDSKNKELQKNVDVYEFMDNEDAELFEFRPSTLMERFKSISNNNKDMPSTSKSQTISIDPEISSESASDGDDFVYMSDDYICSDAETENSLISCEMGNIKGINEVRKPLTPPKRKDTTEKSAVMGKIFKHNAVRTEKKVQKVKEQTKPKANLDQLFDSLLEEEPSSSMLSKNSLSPKNEDDLFKSHSSEENDTSCSRNVNKSIRNDDQQILHESDTETSRKPVRSPSPIPHTSLILQAKKQKSHKLPRKERSIEEDDEFSNRTDSNTTKAHEDMFSLEDRQMNIKHSSHRKKETVNAKCDDRSLNRRITFSPLSNYDDDSLLRVEESLPISEDCLNYKRKSKEKDLKKRASTSSSDKNLSNTFEYNDGILEDSYDTGVARQRARRKCTVGKQNVLAETWSSESEPDGMPRRPNSADSVVAGLSRKKKSRKKEGQAPGGRKNSSRQVLAKHNEVDGSMRSSRTSAETLSKVVPTTRPSAVGPKVRPRHPPYYWSDEEEEQEHVQQHGWIVGDSHKKLVTMLAHAKGKRNNDDKRHLVE